MALYRENGVNPTGGCLPMFLQFPILIVLYDVVRGLAKTADVLNAKGQKIYVHGRLLVKATPQNIPKTSRMYRDLVAAHGQMHVLGINLADSVRTHQPHVVDVLPYAVLVLIAVGLQYVSIWQVTNRNPAAAASNQQMQQMQKYMPLIFLVLYIALPAGVGVYFIVSSLFRVGQQEWMYKHDPTIVKAIQELTKRKHAEALNPSPDAVDTRGAASRDATAGKGFLARMREASGNTGSTRPATGATRRSTGASGPKRRYHRLEGAGQPERLQERSTREEASSAGVQVSRLRWRRKVTTSLEGQATAKGPIVRGMGRDDGKNGRGSCRGSP